MKRISKLMSWLLVLALVLSLVPTSQVEAAKKVKVKKVTVSSSLSDSTKTVVVAKGKKVKLKTTVTVTPNKAANKKVSYASENKKIATVDKKGYVKGVTAGKTKITVTSTKDKKKKATIAVKVVKGAVTKVTLDKTSGTINVGEKVTLKATVKAKKGADKTIAWKSSKKSVATVNSKGEVTAVAVGTAKITAQAIDGSGKKATYTVTVQDPIFLTSVKVLNDQSVTFSLNKAFQLSAGAVSVMSKQYVNGTYRNTLSIDNMTTKDNKTYTVVLKNDSRISENQYVQVSIPSLTGSVKAMETQYTEAVTAYTGYGISLWKVGKAGSDSFGFGAGRGYASYSINKLPAGLTAESKNGYLYVKGTPTAVGKTDAVLTAVDELGNTLTRNISFIVGSDSVMVGAATPVYGVCASNAYKGSSYPLSATGGSGSYRYSVISDPKAIVSRIDSDGELYYSIPIAGDYSVTVRVTDASNSKLYCDIVVPFKIAKGIVIAGCVTDLQGNKVPYAGVQFTNKNKADLYFEYDDVTADSDGVYSMTVVPGTYDIEAFAYGSTTYLYSQPLTVTKSGFDIKLQLNRVVLFSNNQTVNPTEFGTWYDEEGNSYGYGNMVWLKLGTHHLTSTKKNATKNISAKLDINVTATTTQATAVVTVVTVPPAGTIAAEGSISINATGTYKYYVFTPATSGRYYFWSEGDYDTYGQLENVDGDKLASNDDGGLGENFYFSSYCTAGRTYYIGIRSYDGIVPIILKVSATDPSPSWD